MKKELVKATVTVEKVGNAKDYINLPIIRDEKAIGVITECIDNGNGYTLTIALWQEIGLETNNRVPSAIVFG